jgi:hypothetical protein
MVSFVGMALSEIIPIANDFTNFLERLYIGIWEPHGWN